MRTLIISIFTSVIVIAVAYSLLSSGSTGASVGSDHKLVWHSFNEGLEQSSKQNKMVLVDVYTDWCGWCKKMDKEVYTDEKVVAIISEKFVVVKLDAESSEKLRYDGKEFTEQEFARAIGVDGYPTTIFFQPDAQPITRVPGYMEARMFANVLNYIGGEHYKTISYEDFLLKQSSN
ncbi:MAG: thioredoxin family protein [Bacteroidota bacterium]